MTNSKIIVALDLASDKQAIALVEQLDPASCALKVGLEMFSLYGPSFVQKLIAKNFKIFLDLKFHDIPNTVARACRACANLGVWMINIHTTGGLAMMKAARDAVNEFDSSRPLLIGVTVLTSMQDVDVKTIGVKDSLSKQVSRLASLAYEAQLDGVVCSPLEVPDIKLAHGPSFLTVTPGIRPAGTMNQDQQRVTTPVEAIQLGSDFLVIGRPITHADNPSEVVQAIISSLSQRTDSNNHDSSC